MASIRFTDVQACPTEFLDVTSVTLEEFRQLVPPFETAFQAHMAAWRLDGKPRTARRFTAYQNCPLGTPEDRLFFILVYLKTLCPSGGARTLIRDGPGQSQSVDACPPPGAARGAAGPRRCSRPFPDGPGAALGRLGDRRGDRGHATGGASHATERGACHRTAVPPCAHDGTEQHIVRPQDSPARTECYSGKQKDHTVNNVLLVNALLTILFLSDTYAGRVHEKRIAEATPYPLPAGSQLVQDLGFLAFTLPHVEILMPTKKPRGEELTREQQRANQALHHRRLRIEHVHSSVKRCRIVTDRIRLWKEGVRDLVMALCCALHNFRVRLIPWQPMV